MQTARIISLENEKGHAKITLEFSPSGKTVELPLLYLGKDEKTNEQNIIDHVQSYVDEINGKSQQDVFTSLKERVFS